jgi:hypothetical protein
VKAGLIIGAAGVVVGVLVALWASIAAHSPVDIVITLVMTGVVFLALRRTMSPLFRTSKLSQTGVPAEASILKVSDTGATVNQQPEIELLLEVRPKSGARYETTTKTVVSRLQAAWYIPGARVGVRVDPRNPNRVAITDRLDVKGGGEAEKATGTEAPDHARAMALATAMDEYNQKLMAGGETAKARVKEATPLNIFVNGNNPAMKFLLEVMPIGAEPFLAEAGGVISEDSVSKYRPGCEIWVKLDPATKTKVGMFHS